MVDIELDSDLTVIVEMGDDEWTYRVAVIHDSEIITQYGTNTDPRTASGQMMLRNIIGQRVDEYPKGQAEELLNREFQEYKSELAEELE